MSDDPEEQDGEAERMREEQDEEVKGVHEEQDKNVERARPSLPISSSSDVDVITGEPLSPDEMNFRLQIDKEAAAGFIAVDSTYASLRLEIHQPIVSGDVLTSDGDAIMMLQRPNTALQLPLSLNLGEPGQESVVELVRHAVGDFPARVMHHLYAIANDPPYYRQRKVRISISNLLDRLGYTRDRRGIHYSVNRKKLTQTLFALHLTRIEVTRRSTRGRRAQTTQFSANLLSYIEWRTGEDVGEMNMRTAFERGLPEVMRIEINSQWYEGVRREDKRPGRDYQLLPRPEAPAPSNGRRGPKPGGTSRGHSRTVDLLRAYIQRCKQSQAQRVVVERTALLEHAGIMNRNVSMAVNTLKRALTRLVDEETLTAYQVKPSNVEELFELVW